MEENKDQSQEIPAPIQPSTTPPPVDPLQPVEPLAQPTSLPPEETSTLLDQPLAHPLVETHEPELVLEPAVKRPISPWSVVFIFLGVLLFAVVMVFVWLLITGGKGIYDPSGGWIILTVIMAALPVAGIVALINLIGLPFYLFKHKPSLVGWVLGIFSILISLTIVAYTGNFYYQWYAARAHYEQVSKEQEAQKQAQVQQYVKDHAKEEITKEKAIQLLKTCQVDEFNYGAQTSTYHGEWAELSTSGVVATDQGFYTDPVLYNLSVADRYVSELLPIAQTAEKTCVEHSPTITNENE